MKDKKPAPPKQKGLNGDKPVQCPLCRGWFTARWHPQRKIYILFCDFDKIAVAANDPFVGRWDEEYAKGEKIFCPACDHEMRYFCSSTGAMVAVCPKKKCRTRVENLQPDRRKEAKLLDKDGRDITPPGVDRPVASPDKPGLLQ